MCSVSHREEESATVTRRTIVCLVVSSRVPFLLLYAAIKETHVVLYS